jgi:hypothetical protein
MLSFPPHMLKVKIIVLTPKITTCIKTAVFKLFYQRRYSHHPRTLMPVKGDLLPLPEICEALSSEIGKFIAKPISIEIVFKELQLRASISKAIINELVDGLLSNDFINFTHNDNIFRVAHHS